MRNIRIVITFSLMFHARSWGRKGKPLPSPPSEAEFPRVLKWIRASDKYMLSTNKSWMCTWASSFYWLPLTRLQWNSRKKSKESDSISFSWDSLMGVSAWSLSDQVIEIKALFIFISWSSDILYIKYPWMKIFQ